MSKTTKKAAAENVFTKKPAPAASTVAGQDAPAADAAGDGQGAPEGGSTSEGADFSIDGEDEVQKEKESASEAPAPEAPKPAAAKPAEKAKPSARKAAAPSIDGEDEIDGKGGAKKGPSESERNAENAARLHKSQVEAVENARHIENLSRIGRENVRTAQLSKLVRTNPFVRELIAENEALKAENAALKKK